MIILASDNRSYMIRALSDSIRQTEPDAEICIVNKMADVLSLPDEKICAKSFIDIHILESFGTAILEQIRDKYPESDITFIMGFSETVCDTLKIDPRGYIMKPIDPINVIDELNGSSEKIINKEKKRVRIRCFGDFEVFIDDEIVIFKYDKTKEYLAYITDRRAMCSNEDVMAALWERDVSGSYMRTLRKDLIDVFKRYGCEDVFIHKRGKLGIDMNKVSCDYWDWLLGVPMALRSYRGEYMSQYTWAEFTHGTIECKINKIK